MFENITLCNARCDDATSSLLLSFAQQFLDQTVRCYSKLRCQPPLTVGDAETQFREQHEFKERTATDVALPHYSPRQCLSQPYRIKALACQSSDLLHVQRDGQQLQCFGRLLMLTTTRTTSNYHVNYDANHFVSSSAQPFDASWSRPAWRLTSAVCTAVEERAALQDNRRLSTVLKGWKDIHTEVSLLKQLHALQLEIAEKSHASVSDNDIFFHSSMCMLFLKEYPQDTVHVLSHTHEYTMTYTLNSCLSYKGYRFSHLNIGQA